VSGGEQQMLAIGRALMAQPKPCCSRAVARPRAGHRRPHLRRRARAQRAGRHHPARRAEREHALDVSARGYVLETGHVALTDTSDNLRNDERVQAAYLGA
jgi:branched-chain amino acid transport system ATP-binding protein